jgi:hypothetical protein
MNLEDVVNNTDLESFLDGFRATASISGIDFTKSHKVILSCIHKYPILVPKRIKGVSEEETQLKWLKQYQKGYENRPSIRVSGKMGTIADTAVNDIIQGRLPHLSEHNMEQITFAHRLSMSAENILGPFLEEYLSNELAKFNWHCSWGEVTSYVDFCNSDGRLLQVKNRDNSENSSSKKVRENTPIDFWFRVFSRTDRYNWHELNKRNQTEKFSEENFSIFYRNTIKKNPDALNVEPNNPWAIP